MVTVTKQLFVISFYARMFHFYDVVQQIEVS